LDKKKLPKLLHCSAVVSYDVTCFELGQQ